MKKFNTIGKKNTPASGKETGIRTLKIALISSFTFDGMKKCLMENCSQAGLHAQIYLGKYGQHNQEILDKESGLHRFSPEVIIVFIDIQSFLGKDFFSLQRESDGERSAFLDRKEQEVKDWIDHLVGSTGAKVIFHNFEAPTYSPLGILENKQRFGFIEMIQTLNIHLRDFYKNSSQVFIFDYDAFCSKIGKESVADPKMYYLGDLKVDFRNLPRLSREYLSYLKPIANLAKKCLVLDLDNTLWGGILGEEGMENIKLGPTPEGRPFWEFQHHILNLFHKGVILAINSKNNKDEALAVLRTHPHMALRENHFAAMRINWENKAKNMEEIAKELNIGIESLVFLDDDKTNQEMVRQLLPAVSVVDLPDDPALYVNALENVNDFNTLQWTDEDRERGKMYVAERERGELKKTTANITDFFKSLNLKVVISDADRTTLPRVAQLTQKTNQFNLTTKRYSEKQVEKFFQSKHALVKQVAVTDKFGDYGITGVAIIKKEPAKWIIDTFLLSCRVLGKDVEKAFVSKILEDAKRKNVKEVTGEFIPTPKNTPAQSFYADCGFKLVKKSKERSQWSFNVAGKIPVYQTHIQVYES